MDKKARILGVEDSPTQAEELKYLLEKHNYQVSLAKNGREAWEWLNQQAELPEIVITDIVMPEIDGYELCKKIKDHSKFADIPVILLTSLSDPMDVVQGLEAGADNFITKPYEERFLTSRIEHILINQEMRKQPRSQIGVEVYFAGKRHFLTSNRLQIIDLLLSTYENAIEKNRQLKATNEELIGAQKSLKEKNQKLLELNEFKNRLLGMASHDLRNPLNVILLCSEFIEMDSDDLSTAHKLSVHRIKESCLFMVNLINDFLDYSMIEEGHLTLKMEKLDFQELVESNLLLNRLLSEKKGIKILFSSPSETSRMIGDKNKIEQVLNNLISNAIKFSHSETTIEVEARREEDQLLLSVKDQGLGIPEEELENLFTPFKKTSVKATWGEKGTGLGLMIVKKIVETHGGKIWAESEVGKGSTFYVALPLAKE